MLYLWMPEANGAWFWSTGENWLQASSLEQLIQDLQPHQGKEPLFSFPVVMLRFCNNRSPKFM
jgi:general secretion pathway protein L